jgi:hypothetical protein
LVDVVEAGPAVDATVAPALDVVVGAGRVVGTVADAVAAVGALVPPGAPAAPGAAVDTGAAGRVVAVGVGRAGVAAGRGVVGAGRVVEGTAAGSVTGVAVVVGYTGPPEPPSPGVVEVGAGGSVAGDVVGDAVVDGASVVGSACCGTEPASCTAAPAAAPVPVTAAAVRKAASRRLCRRMVGSLGRPWRGGLVVLVLGGLAGLTACDAGSDAGAPAADTSQGSPPFTGTPAASGSSAPSTAVRTAGSASGSAPGSASRPAPGPTGPTASSPSAAPASTRGVGPTACAAPGAPAREVVGAGGPLAFEEATADQGFEDPLTGMMAHAVALADVDGDGWTDVFVGTFGDRDPDEYAVRGAGGPAPDRLLLGGPDGARVDGTFAGGEGRTAAAAFADLDADGDADLVVIRNWRDGPVGSAPSVVYRNDGGRLAEAGALVTRMSGRAVVPVDLGGDGHLDLVVLADRFGRDGTTTRVFRGDGALGFEDVTRDVLPADVRGLGAAAADLSGDGWPDLVVAGEAGRNRLFVNDGAGRLEEPPAQLDWPVHGEEDDTAGVAVGDLNRDGRLDVVIGHHYTSTTDFGERVPVRVYLNEATDAAGVPRLRDVTDEAGIPGLSTKAPEVEIADFDADGWPDLLVGASAGGGSAPGVLRHTGLSGSGRPGGGAAIPTFEPAEGFGDAQYWVTGGVFDADRDGRLDVLMAEFDPAKPSPFWRNTGPAGHWLAVADAPLGSLVEVYEPGGLGDPARLLGARALVANTGYGSGALAEAWFGTGAETVVDVRIVPPFGAGPVDRPGVTTC